MYLLLSSSQELSFKCWENLVITPAHCWQVQLSWRELWYEFCLWSQQVDIAGGKDDKYHDCLITFVTVCPWLVKTYRHGISEIFLKMVLNTKKTKTNQTIRPLIILRFVSVTSQGLYFQCGILWVFCVQWVKMRGDCLFCWYWWNCYLNFRFM